VPYSVISFMETGFRNIWEKDNKIAMTLRVSADDLLFGKTERGPDEDLRMQFEAISRFTDDEKKVVRSVLEGLLLTHEAPPLDCRRVNRARGAREC
jgi:hypothetical protein